MRWMLPGSGLQSLIVITLFGKVTWVSSGTSFSELIGTVGAVESSQVQNPYLEKLVGFSFNPLPF
jgi:hypothetical protein